MMNLFKKLFREEEGQAMAEYGLILGLIAIAVIAVLGTMGGQLDDLFQLISTSLGGVTT
jgi:pilus assembly protein Flp/PilA